MFVTKKHIPQETQQAGRARMIFQSVRGIELAHSCCRRTLHPGGTCSKWYFWTAGTLPILLVIKQLVSRAP